MGIAATIVRQAHDDLVYHGITIKRSADVFGVEHKKLAYEVKKILTHPIRACNPNSKLSEKTIADIMKLAGFGATQKDIAFKVGTSLYQVSLVLRGMSHMYVTRVCETKDRTKHIDAEFWRPGVSGDVVDFATDITGWGRHTAKVACLTYCESTNKRILNLGNMDAEDLFRFLTNYNPPKRGRKLKV